jgi:hypothetical protein
MKRTLLSFAALAASLIALPSSAHHSFAMFDQTKLTKVEGTVKELEYINPHAWLHIVAQQNGKPVTWSFEMGSVGQLTRDGWKRDTVKAGDKIAVTFHPLKDGSHGGQFRTMVVDGKEICQGGATDTPCSQTKIP